MSKKMSSAASQTAPDEATRQHKKLTQRLVAGMARTSINYKLLEPDDKILVAMSGGKDSAAMLLLLDALKPRLPFACSWIPVFVDQGLPGLDTQPLYNWLQARGQAFEVVHEDTYSVVRAKTKPGAQPCPLCARLRRGILYSTAQRLKCNKIALGHHRDDALATLLMNLFYTGTLQAMPARYQTDDGRFAVLRPMIELAEDDLVRWIAAQDVPIISSPACAGHKDHQREAMEALMRQLELRHPQLRQVMAAALKRVRSSHLLDLRLL